MIVLMTVLLASLQPLLLDKMFIFLFIQISGADKWPSTEGVRRDETETSTRGRTIKLELQPAQENTHRQHYDQELQSA